MTPFRPAVEALEERYALSAPSPRPSTPRPSTSWKEEVKAFERRSRERMKVSFRRPALAARPRSISLPRFRSANVQPVRYAHPAFRLAPERSLQWYWIVWHARLQKFFSVGDGKLADWVALHGGEAARTQYGVVVLRKVSLKPRKVVPSRPANPRPLVIVRDEVKTSPVEVCPAGLKEVCLPDIPRLPEDVIMKAVESPESPRPTLPWSEVLLAATLVFVVGRLFRLRVYSFFFRPFSSR